MKNLKMFTLFTATIFLISCGGDKGGGNLGCVENCGPKPEEPVIKTCEYLSASNFGEEAMCACPALFVNDDTGYSCIEDPNLPKELSASQTSFDFGTQLINEKDSVKIVPLTFNLTNTGQKTVDNIEAKVKSLFIGNSGVRVRSLSYIPNCKTRQDLSPFDKQRCMSLPTCESENLTTLQETQCQIQSECSGSLENPLTPEKIQYCVEQTALYGSIDDLPAESPISLKTMDGSACENILPNQTCTAKINLDPFELGSWDRDFSLEYGGEEAIDFSAMMEVIAIGPITLATISDEIVSTDGQPAPDTLELIGDYVKKVTVGNLVHELFPAEAHPLARKIEVTVTNGKKGLFLYNPGILEEEGVDTITYEITGQINPFFYVKSNAIQFDDGQETVALTIKVLDIDNEVLFQANRNLDFERKSNGNLICWGSATASYLSEFDPRTKAKIDLGLNNLSEENKAIDVFLGNGTICPKLEDGTSRCVGSNNFGLLSKEVEFLNVENEETDGVQVKMHKDFSTAKVLENALDGILMFSNIEINETHACGLDNVGNHIYCWGDPQRGALGLGAFFAHPEPQTTEDFKTILTGRHEILEIAQDDLGNSTWKVVRTGNVPNFDEETGELVSVTALTCGLTMDGKQISCFGFGDDNEMPTARNLLNLDNSVVVEDFDLNENGVCYLSTEGRRYCSAFNVDFSNRGCTEANKSSFPERCALDNFDLVYSKFQATKPLMFEESIITDGGVGFSIINQDMLSMDYPIYQPVLELEIGPFLDEGTPLENVAVNITTNGRLEDLSSGGLVSNGVYQTDSAGMVKIIVSAQSTDVNVQASLNQGDVSLLGERNYVDKKMVEMKMGTDFNCLLSAEKDLYCSGKNDKGQLGLGDLIDRTSPVKVVKEDGSPLKVKEFALGEGYACVIEDVTDYVYCWGHQINNFQEDLKETNFARNCTIDSFDTTCFVYPVAIKENNSDLLKSTRIKVFKDNACAIIKDDII